MNTPRTLRQLTPALFLLSLLSAGLLSSPTQAGLVTDFLNTTNATSTNYFLGKVGIGTNKPAQMLDIVGNLHATGTGTFTAVIGNGSGLTARFVIHHN